MILLFLLSLESLPPLEAEEETVWGTRQALLRKQGNSLATDDLSKNQTRDFCSVFSNYNKTSLIYIYIYIFKAQNARAHTHTLLF